MCSVTTEILKHASKLYFPVFHVKHEFSTAYASQWFVVQRTERGIKHNSKSFEQPEKNLKEKAERKCAKVQLLVH